MGIDIADLVEQARHGMYEAGLAPQDYLGALAEKEHGTGSPFGLTTDKFREMLHAIGTQHGVAMRVDEAAAEIVPTVSSIDLKSFPGSMAAIAKILNHIGQPWTFRTDGFDADNVSLTAGDRAGQKATTLGIVKAAIACGAKTLLMPECGHSFTEMRWEAANAFGGDLPFRVLQITEFLAEALTDGRLKVNKVAARATYHDACQVSRRGGATAAPRIVLAALGVELTELEDAGDANWCCGGGGGVALINRAAPLRAKAFEIKQRQIEATGMATVYTSCSGCRQTLEHGGKATQWTTNVASLLELVADNLAAKTEG
jgi:Fe-S oxidoreductase